MASWNEIAVDALRRQAGMEARRANWDSIWQQIAERLLPRQDIFNRRGPIVEGERRDELIFDSTPTLALDKFAAAIDSLLTPATSFWHKLSPVDPNLDEDRDTQLYCEELRKIIFRARYSPRANFASQAHENYMSIGAFGNGTLFVDEVYGQNLRYRACNLSEMYWSEDHVGLIDTVHRRFPMTARQCVQKWGEDALPGKIVEAARNSAKSEQEFEILHCVLPREDMDYQAPGFRGMPYASYYVSIDGQQMIKEGGFRTMPYPISRYTTGPREIYGRGPGMTMLPDIKMLHTMSKDIMAAAHKIVRPPVLLMDDGVLAAYDMRPGAQNYGGLIMAGDRLYPAVQEMESRANLPIGQEMLEERRKMINDGFYVTLFQILVDNPQMTATEALLRAQEKGQLLGPPMGRQQSEWFGVQIARELDILHEAGLLPEPPSQLIEAGGLRIEYSAPLNRFMRAEEGVAIVNTIQSIAPFAAVDPGIMQIFDGEKTARTLAEINGVPMSVLRSKEEFAQIKDQQAQAAQMQQLIQAAPLAGKAAKDFAGAASTAGNIPQPQQAQ